VHLLAVLSEVCSFFQKGSICLVKVHFTAGVVKIHNAMRGLARSENIFFLPP
jgi:hypothetical protein